MNVSRPLVAGVAGAITLTVLNEVGRRIIPHAPRLETLGMRSLAKVLRSADQPVPDKTTLFYTTLVGDLASNALLYSLVGAGGGNTAFARGGVLGAAVGALAAYLPPKLGLGHQPGEETPTTQVLTVAWYTFSGLVAAAAAQALVGEPELEEVEQGFGEGI